MTAETDPTGDPATVSDPFSLRDRRAVVTGASTGIGSAIAVALAAAGAHVAGIHLTDPDGAAATARQVRAHGVRCRLIEGDTGDPAQVERLAAEAQEHLGGIDIWINNAARLMVKPLLDTTDDDWHGLLGANLHGYFYGCRAAGRAMVGQGTGGRIVNVTSAADVLAVADLGAYTPEVRRTYEQRIALHRIGTPEEVADATLFLASDASRYMTGQELVLDGGLTINGTVGHARD